MRTNNISHGYVMKEEEEEQKKNVIIDALIINIITVSLCVSVSMVLIPVPLCISWRNQFLMRSSNGAFVLICVI